MLDYLAQALYESYDPLVGEKLPWESFDEKNKDYFRRSAKTLALKLFEKMKLRLLLIKGVSELLS